MKTTLLSLLLLAVACGNPHLEKVEGLGSKKIPVIAEPKVLTALGIKTDNGLSYVTELPSQSKTMELLNLDTDKNWNMELSFEKGTNFRFKGSAFPGERGSCKTELPSSEKCLLDIEFFSGVAGFYADNLTIRYVSASNSKDVRSISYALRGERTTTVKPDDNEGGDGGDDNGDNNGASGTFLLSIRAINSDKLLDFGKSFVNETIKSHLIVKNIGTKDVTFESVLVSGKEMRITDGGTCSKELTPDDDCILEVSFNSSKTGLFQDTVQVSYNNTEISFPILGEKIQKKKQGPLVASEVFSNNVNFGKVKTGLTVTKQVEIQNLGETVYNLKDVILSNKEVFKVFSNCGPVIYPGTCLIDVSYSPIAARLDSGSLKVTTNEGDSVTLTLSGEGITEARTCDTWNEYLVVPEKSHPSSDVIFPYLNTHPDTKSALSNLYGLEVNGYVKATDNYVVKNGMVYITFKLPEMKGTITNMNFGVKVLKVIQDNYKDTESLCLSSNSVRKCSGHEFSLASWQQLKNPKFWDVYTKPVSERYEKQFASGERACGSYRCMNLNTQYELSDIFEMSENEMQKLRDEGTITLIFSDDTRMLKMPRIAIKTKTTKSCE